RVLELAEPRLDVRDGPADELDLLVGVGVRLASLDVLREVEMHLLAAEAGRRPERRQLAPAPTRQSALLAQLAPRRRRRLLALLPRPGGQLEQPPPGRLAQLPNEGDAAVAVDCHDRHRAGMLDDLALVLAPTLDRDAEQLPRVDRPRLVGPSHLPGHADRAAS